MATEVDLKELLSEVDGRVADEMASNPEVIDAGEDFEIGDLSIVARRWYRLYDVYAVVADLIGSTNLGVGKHVASTAAIYEASTGGVCRILSKFDADFIAIQGDGAFGLYWGDRGFERAICAGITIKTFSQKHLEPRLEKKWPEEDDPKTGLKVGIATSRLLVKRVGVERTEHQEPVWAGKAVNYAAKCAQQAGLHEMIVTGSVADRVNANDYLAVSCPCGNGPSDTLWSNVTIDKIHEGDGQRAGRKLKECWCDVHGPGYCAAVLDGRTKRDDAALAMEAALKAQRADGYQLAQQKRREDLRNIRRGLRMRNG